MGKSQLFEQIVLDQKTFSFHRVCNSSAAYYHWHQCIEFLYISSGYGVIVVDNQHYTARPGRIFIFPPYRLHKVQVNNSDKNPYYRTTIYVEPSVIDCTLSSFPRHQAKFAALYSNNSQAKIYDLSEYGGGIERIFAQFEHMIESEQISACEVTFLVMQLMTFFPEHPRQYSPHQKTISSQIMNWIDVHHASKFSLTRLSSELGLSRSYTSRIFRKQTGGSIHEYLLARRIQRSCDLLRYSNESIYAIAKAVGFSEETYFITCFKKMMRQTPLKYRRSSQEVNVGGSVALTKVSQ